MIKLSIDEIILVALIWRYVHRMGLSLRAARAADSKSNRLPPMLALESGLKTLVRALSMP